MKDTFKKHKRHQKKRKKKIELSLFFKKEICKTKKKKILMSTQNEKTAKNGETWKTYGNNEKSLKRKK